MSNIRIVQTCLPDYRLPFFERLVSAMPDAKLICGRDYFTPSLSLCKEPASWRTYIENEFSFSRAFLWQPGVHDLTGDADVVIAEFNPRILSTWSLLVRRRLRGKRTLLWGHLWGQHGPVWLSRHIRLLMLQLSDGMITYNRSQAEELSRLLPDYPVWTAANSCVTRAMCVPARLPRGPGCIAYVGRLIKGKKAGLLLEAFAKALGRLPAGTKLILAGDGPEWGAIQQQIADLGLRSLVETPGHVASEIQLKAIYARSLVAVSPGYVGLSAIQCMAYGVPMLVSRDEPHSPEIEACVEGKTSEFFATDDVADLAAKLVSFSRPDSPWRDKRSEISGFIARNYTFDGMVESFAAAGAAGRGVAIERVAFVWAQFGPYHLARLCALRQEFGVDRILGVEIASRTLTYAWERGAAAGEGLVTLIPGAAVEQAAAADIYRAAMRVFRQRNVNVVFVPSYWPASSLAVLMAARTAGARVVMMNDSHAHTAKARGIWAEMKRRLVLQFDAALVAGAPQRDYFSSLGMQPRKIVLGYDAVDNDYFAANAAKARGDPPSPIHQAKGYGEISPDAGRQAKEHQARVRAKHGLPERYFLNVGRMIWKKNLETLIDAYKLAKDRVGSNCPRLVLVGSGKLEKVLHERCFAAGLSVFKSGEKGMASQHGDADVIFLGFRQAEELPEFYALASAFILPSREEEWGLVVNEAMACGLPVLVSRVVGCAKDLVRDGENGFLFDPFDAKALAGHLERIARQPELTKTMGVVSRRIIADWGCDRFAQAAREATEIALGVPEGRGRPTEDRGRITEDGGPQT